MKAAIIKTQKVALSLLLIGLICIPVPAISAFAEEADGETIEPTEQTSEPVDETEEEAESTEADVNETDAGTEAEDASDFNDTAIPDEAAEASEDDGIMPLADEKVIESPTAGEVKTDDTTASKVSNTAELEAAFAKANAQTTSNAYTITLAADINVASSLTVSAGKNVTIEGSGHTIILGGSAQLDVNGTLTLNGALTIQADGTHTGTMIVVTAGTLNMNSGVTIEGNHEDSAPSGGGVQVTNSGTFNMNGGTIENYAASRGGGVYVSVATFNMSGDATIQNCLAYGGQGNTDTGDGGGVYMTAGRSTAQMTMSGNASIRNNRATSTGGGIEMQSRTILTMEDNASIVGNTADAGGGVLSYGMATLTAVYGNTTTNGASDIFSLGRAKVSPVNHDWILPQTGTPVDAWYIDEYYGASAAGEGHSRWNAGDENNVVYTPSNGFVSGTLTLAAGAPLPEAPHVNVIWENEDGTVLYEMDDVKSDEVPAADEYTELSGHDEPTEPNTAEGYAHEFTGWTESHPSDDEVLYIATYDLIAPNDAHAHTLTVHYVDENGNQVAPDYVEEVEEGDPYDITSPHVDGYEAETEEVTGTVPDNDVEETVVYHATGDTTTPADGNATDGDATSDEGDGSNEMAGDASRALKVSSLSQTGDEMGYAMMALVGVFGVAAVALGAAGIKMRKREQ